VAEENRAEMPTESTGIPIIRNILINYRAEADGITVFSHWFVMQQLVPIFDQ
jgi:hypothetical protein